MCERPADWEYDFSPNPNTEVCQQCGQVYIAEAGHQKTVYVGGETETFFYCSRYCLHEHYLDRLRREVW
jgi:hypothetical protein